MATIVSLAAVQLGRPRATVGGYSRRREKLLDTGVSLS
jgi:hypothetical protein